MPIFHEFPGVWDLFCLLVFARHIVSVCMSGAHLFATGECGGTTVCFTSSSPPPISTLAPSPSATLLFPSDEMFSSDHGPFPLSPFPPPDFFHSFFCHFHLLPSLPPRGPLQTITKTSLFARFLTLFFTSSTISCQEQIHTREIYNDTNCLLCASEDLKSV